MQVLLGQTPTNKSSRARGEPTLDWFEIQPEFKYSKADVLLILDCCYAGQSARGREEPDRIELLAACVMGLKTPRPGPDSFTSRLMMELRRAVSTGKPFSTAQLARRLAKADAGLVQSPYYLPLQAEGHNKPIVLKPLFQTTETEQSSHEAACLLTFHVSMSKELTTNVLPDIVKWLKDGAPEVVSDLSVKEVIVSSEKLHEFAFTQPSTHHPPLFQKLDDVAKHDILDTWNDLCKFIASADAELATPISKEMPGSIDGVSALNLNVQTYFSRLNEMNLRMSRAIQRNVLKLNELEDPVLLENIAEDKLAQSIGLADPLRVKMAVVSPLTIASDLRLPEANSIDGRDTLSGSKGLVDYRYYGANEGGNVVSMITSRIQQLAALLNRSTSTDFRTLRCRGWLHEPSLLRFGLVFDVPHIFDCTPLALNHIIKSTKGIQRPPLEKRFLMAETLGRAVQTWHSVGWLHQNIGSGHIILFRRRDTSDIDYDKPYLGGFEFARPNAAYSIPRGHDTLELDIYRHPDRQGNPQRPHRKEDDLYSFGVLLLEIGLWQLASDMLGSGKSDTRPSAVAIRDKLLDNSRQRLSHYMGTSYAHAVDTCLSGDLDFDLDDRTQSRLARTFEEQVLDNLAVRPESRMSQ